MKLSPEAQALKDKETALWVRAVLAAKKALEGSGYHARIVLYPDETSTNAVQK